MTYMIEEQWNILAREKIQKARGHLADALEAISKPECDFSAASHDALKAWITCDKVIDLIDEGRQFHGDE